MNDQMGFAEMQRIFSQRFPYLKIEMVRCTSASCKNVADRESSCCRVQRVNATVSKDVFESLIGPLQTGLHLEAEFLRLSGQRVNVLRRSGNLWIATTLTTGWTLEQQNREGRSMSQANEEKLIG